MDEIRSLVTDPENLAFDEWKYSYNDLLAVMKDIEREMWDQPNEPVIYGVGIGWTTIDGEVTGFGDGGKEFRVVVQVSENVFSELTEKYRDKYGDMVYVEGSQALFPSMMLNKALDMILGYWRLSFYFVWLYLVYSS